MKNKSKAWIVVIAILALALLAGFLWNYATRAEKVDDVNVLVTRIEKGEVTEVKINGDVITFKDKSNKKYEAVIQVDKFTVPVIVEVLDENGKVVTTELKGSLELSAFINYYNKTNGDKSDVKLTMNDRSSGNIMNTIMYVVMIVGMILLAIFLFRGMSNAGGGKGAMSFGKSKANMQGNVKVRFSDVAGAEEEKEELKEIVEFLKHPQKFTSVGARIPRGVLLVGPPGTGKTLFAKAVAGEANVPFFSISGSDFVEMYVGVGASRVRDLFDTAKKNMPCIIFIDEIDAVGRQRGAGLGGGNDEREQTLNQLLVQMDGFATNDGIIVMAATNRSDILDPALMRPGRFDRQVYVNTPDVRGREAIFRVHARNKPLASDVDFQVLARITSGFSGADIANVLNEAAILCARDNRQKINMEDINEAIAKVGMGPEKKSRLVTEYDKRITAYHEAGHAIVGKSMPGRESVHMVTIVPRGNAGGFTWYRPEEDSQFRSKKQYLAEIASAMGGRAAEKLVIGDITQGAIGDIQQATNIARVMVTRLGMSDLGPVCYGSSQEVFIGRDYQQTLNYSDDTARKIDAEVSKLVGEGMTTAESILTENRDKLDTMARVLLECETIFSEEVDMIMEGKSADEVIAALKTHLQQKYENKKVE